MLPNTIALSSTLPRVKNKNYSQNVECVSYSKSVDFQRDRKSWPLPQVVECVALDTVSHISPSESVNESNIVDSIPLHNGCVTVFQAENVQTDSKKDLFFDDSPTNNATNVLKIVLPLVNENVPLSCQSPTVVEDELLPKLFSVNNNVQYSPKHCEDVPVCVSKYVNNRNHSLPEDNELNRFSSTFENIKSLLKEGLVDGLDEMPPDFLPPNPPLLYRVSSLPNLSHDSTKNHNSCSYLTMCATKHELFMNKLCKNIAKHDMSVQVSTELFKTQNEKIYVDTSCQTEDIFLNCQVNDEVLTKDTDHNFCHTSSNILYEEHEMKINADNEIQCDLGNDSIGYTNVFNKEFEHKTHVENDCTNTGYTNINIFNIECETKTNEEENCASFDYVNTNILHNEHEVNANEEDCTSVGYININAFITQKKKPDIEDGFTNVSYTKITTFNKENKIKSDIENCTNIDYTNMNVIDNGNEVGINDDELCSKINCTNMNLFDKEHEVKTNGEDCVDIGYTNFRLYDKGLEVDSNDDCENYANANILEEFVNEQLSLNNTDGDFDSFLFGPLPPSPIEENVSELPIINNVETKRENSAPVPFIFDVHKNQPSTSIIKSRSIDAEFSHNFQQHQKIGTRSVQSERRTYPSEIPISDGYPKPLMPKSSIHPSTIEKLSDISSSLPDTPLLGRCDFPRQYSATGTKTMTQMSNSLSINMRGAGHGSSIGLGQAMAGAELLHLNGPGRGWYPRQRQFRPVSVEQLDKLASKSPVGHSQWDSREGHKPVTLPPNLTPKFFHRSPREALRRVTSLLIRKGLLRFFN
uniref:Uncharacterized protein n=1 Tax=Sipha flava TaxID=143950 RepID=A0A2S2QIW7_9HEMI